MNFISPIEDQYIYYNAPYESKYSENIEILYGNKRESDDLFNRQNELPHIYSITNKYRIDMTIYETYSIDPPGCDDADDAFSIFIENDKMFLAIHIADPTELINIESPLWSDMISRIVTKYPSNRKPIHLMPEFIVHQSSLIENTCGNIKNAITILTEIDQTTYMPIGNIKQIFSIIKVSTSNAMSYTEAVDKSMDVFALVNGLRISKSLFESRSTKTFGTKLNEISPSMVVFKNKNIPILTKVCTIEHDMKQMIAEFAIFANSFIGEFLKINLNGTGIFRTCAANAWLDTVSNDIVGVDLLHEIITQGIRADYMSSCESHDLVGMPEYCHFTSPIRRISDCICHYLLKYIYLNNQNCLIHIPFNETELELLSEKCVVTSRNIKKIQYKDTKFRMIQAMNHYLKFNKPVIKLTFFMTSYSGLFLNIIICKINEHNVQLSYTLRVKNYKGIIGKHTHHTIDIYQVNCLGLYDQGSIPELDEYITKVNITE